MSDRFSVQGSSTRPATTFDDIERQLNMNSQNSRGKLRLSDIQERLNRMPGAGSQPMERYQLKAPSSQEKIRGGIMGDLILEGLGKVPFGRVSDTADAIKLAKNVFKGYEVQRDLRAAMGADELYGNLDYPRTKRYVLQTLTEEIGTAAASQVIKASLAKGTGALGMVTMLLGPGFIEAAAKDVPNVLEHVKEDTGFIWDENGIRFRWPEGGYNPFDRKHVYEVVRWGRENISDPLTKFLKSAGRTLGGAYEEYDKWYNSRN